MSREQLLTKNYKENDPAKMEADFDPSPTFRQLANFARELADKVTRSIQTVHGSTFEQTIAVVEHLISK